MRQYIERSVFFHSRYDEAEVVNDGFLVRVQYTSASSLVITPHGKKFGGKMFIIILCHFDNEG